MSLTPHTLAGVIFMRTKSYLCELRHILPLTRIAKCNIIGNEKFTIYGNIRDSELCGRPPDHAGAALLRLVFYTNKFFRVKKLFNCHVKSVAYFNDCKQARIFG